MTGHMPMSLQLDFFQYIIYNNQIVDVYNMKENWAANTFYTDFFVSFLFLFYLLYFIFLN